MNVIILAICLFLAVFQVKPAVSKSSECCKDTSKEHKCHCHHGHGKDTLTMRTFYDKAMKRFKNGKLDLPEDPRDDSLFLQFQKFMFERKPEKTESKSKKSKEEKPKSKEASKESSSSSKESQSKSRSESKESKKSSSKSESKEKKKTPRTFFGLGGTIAVNVMPSPPPPTSSSSDSKSSKESVSKSRSSEKSKESKSSKSSSSKKSSESDESKSKDSSESKSSKSSETKESESSRSSSRRSRKSSKSTSEERAPRRKLKFRHRIASKILGDIQQFRIKTRVKVKVPPSPTLPPDPLDDFLKGYYSTKTESEDLYVSSQSPLSDLISVRIIFSLNVFYACRY